MKIPGFRSKTNWKMGLATLVYGFIALFIIIAIIDPSSEEVAGDVEAEDPSANVEEVAEEVEELVVEEVEEVSLLTTEIENKITEWVSASTMYELYKLEADESTVEVWIELNDDATSDAEGYANGLAERVAGLYDYEVKVSVTAMQTMQDSDKIRAFGNSLFRPGKEVEYQTY